MRTRPGLRVRRCVSSRGSAIGMRGRTAGERCCGAEEEEAHGGAERAIAADGERRAARDRAGEVAELHRRGPEAGHGRPELGRRGKGERARDQRARPREERGAREKSRAHGRHPSAQVRREQSVTARRTASSDKSSPRFAPDKAPAGEVAGDVGAGREGEQAARELRGGPVRLGEERACVDERSRPGGVGEQLGRQPACKSTVGERGASAGGP